MTSKSHRRLLAILFMFGVGLAGRPASAAGPQIRLAAIEGPQAAAASVDGPRAPRALVRAYAVDGSSFYYEGRRVVADGLAPAVSGLINDHARQRLQQLLDSGEISFDGFTDPDTGAIRARVWIDGRPLAELIP